MMDLKELWNQDAITDNAIRGKSSFTTENYKSIDIFASFEKRIHIISKISIVLSIFILSVYFYIGLYKLAIAITFILLLSTYISFSFLRRFKKNRFVLNLRDYLKETSAILSNYIRFSLYGILLIGFLVVPFLYIIGINSYFNSIDLFSFSIFKVYPGLLVGFVIGILLSIFISLSILYKVYYKFLKEVNLEIKSLED